MRRGNRRWIAGLLAAVMLLTAVPVSAAEAEETPKSVPPVEEESGTPEQSVSLEETETTVPNLSESLEETETTVPNLSESLEETETTVPNLSESPEETDGMPDLLSDTADVTGSYTTWQNAPVIGDGQTASFTLSSYDSSYTANQVWFAVNVPADDYAIQMDFGDVTKNMYVYLYDRAELTTSGPTGSNYEHQWQITANGTRSWKAEHAGTYYLMLRPQNSSNLATYPATLTIDMVEPDLNENNDTWNRATELTRNVNTYYTLNGQNDEDWFKITTTMPGEAIKLVLSNFDYTVSEVEVAIYSGAALTENSSAAYLTRKADIDTDTSISYKVNEPGDYYVRIQPDSSNGYVTKALKVRYETVSGDEHEVNDNWNTATALAFDAPVEFTLNGENDEDWFKFVTTTANALVYLSFRGFDTDYSNEIRYYVYDPATGGYDSDYLAYQAINMTHSTAITFANTGIHYIRIDLGGDPVENPLTMTITGGVIDNCEPNDTWQEATPLNLSVAQPFKIPATSDVDWFQFTVDEPNMTVAMTFDIPSGGQVRYDLYAGEDLAMYGENSASRLDDQSTIRNGQHTYYYMLPDAGTYYLRVDDYSSDIFSDDATITYTLVPPDNNERNNTWKTATALNLGKATSFTLPADNDADYFKFEATEDNQTVELTFTIPSGGAIYCYLYAGADYEIYGDNADRIIYWSGISGGNKSYRCMLGDAGTYYVRVEDYSSDIFDEDATITYTLIQPDANEGNNTRNSATVLREEVATSYTLPASNDEDWFQFTTTEDYQTAELTFNVPEDGRVYYSLYSKADIDAEGENAGSIDYQSNIFGEGKVYRHMLDEAGTYYVRVEDYSSNIFDEDATVTYRLIDPDENEKNNAWDSATAVSAQQAESFTLPADNDYDWFALGEVTPGDIIALSGWGIQHSSGNILYVSLYVVEEGQTATTFCEDWSVSSNRTSFSQTFTAQKAGNYYVRFSTSGSHWLTEPMWFQYAITGASVAVTGVAISNGGVTIAEGQTLQLHANVSPSNATNQAVTWESSTPSVATIDATGLVTAKSEGSTTITVTTDDGRHQAITTITVTEAIPVTGITLTAEGYTEYDGTETEPRPLALGESLQMTASVVPDTATQRGITWTVSNPNVLAVTSNGKVYAVGSGTAKVTATTVDGEFSKDYWISVPNESYPVQGISLNYNAATIYMDEGGLNLVATISPEYATSKAVTWESDNPEVATVDQSGRVTPVSVGYATITVRAVSNSGITNSCLISVQPKRVRVTGISVPETSMNLGLYGTVTLQPEFTPSNATDQTVTWQSSNSAVVSVSRTGVVTAIGLGSAIITATSNDDGHQATITVTVSLNADYGDVSNDGAVDVADALMVLKSSVNLLALTDEQKKIADVNGDNFVDAADAILILRYNVDLIDKFPVEEP